MEHEKDINKKDTLNQSDSGSQNRQIPFQERQALFRDKALKVSSAVHLVTELFSETEPIRNALREQGINLIMVASDMSLSDHPETQADALRVLETSSSLITVLHTSKLLSDMNASILLAELRSLKDLIATSAQQQPHTISEIVLHELFAETAPTPLMPNPSSYEIQLTQDKGQNFQHHKMSLNQKKTEPLVSNHRQLSTSKTAVSRTSTTAPASGKKDRSTMILNAIVSSGSSIKDIAKIVKGCSEKTVQRELNALIKKGLIVREGEKRWSVYKKT